MVTSFLVDSGANMSLVSTPSAIRPLQKPIVIQGFNGTTSKADRMGTVRGSVTSFTETERHRKSIQSTIAGVHMPKGTNIISVSQLTRGTNIEVCFKANGGSISLTDMGLSIPLRMTRGLYFMDMDVDLNQSK